MEYHQITIDEWSKWKEEIRQKLAESAGNFVYIGYRLSQIRDSGMYDGAADVFEFAEKEYGLGRSTVSRFIAINEKYSNPENRLELREEFRAFSSSKLAEMLTLPDSELEMVSEKSTVEDIRKLKSFTREEPEEIEEDEEDDLPRAVKDAIRDFFKNPDRKEAFNRLIGEIDTRRSDAEDDTNAQEKEAKEIFELLNPSGALVHRKGICFLSFMEYNKGVKWKLMSTDPESMTYEEFYNAVYDIYSDELVKYMNKIGISETFDLWEEIYGKGEKNEKAKAEDTGAVVEDNAPVEDPPAPEEKDGEDQPSDDRHDPGDKLKENAKKAMHNTATAMDMELWDQARKSAEHLVEYLKALEGV